MGITTKRGFRKSAVAKEYQAWVFQHFGKRISLMQARKECAAIEKIASALGPLPQRKRGKVIQAVSVLID